MIYKHLNDIYITDRLEVRLSEIARHVVTTVTAPMGYGKTTAIRYWQTRMSESYSDTVILRQNIFNDSIGDLWRRFCRLLSKHEAKLAGQLLKAGFPIDNQGCGLIADLWEEFRSPESSPVWWILDDVHLLPSGTLEPLIDSLSKNLDGLHIILLSRNRILTRPEQMKLGRCLCQIRAEDLALTESEMRKYVEFCGLPLNGLDAERIMKATQGWIGLIYLLLCLRIQNGNWGFDTPDLFVLIDQVMFDPLPEHTQNLLLRCCVVDEFTQEQAAFLSEGNENTETLLTVLSENNAFITVNEEGLYRCHNMLIQTLRRHFEKLPDFQRRAVFKRLGDWYFSQFEYLKAMFAYRRAEAWKKLLNAVIADRGNSLDGEQKSALLDWCANCPETLLRSQPEALLILTLGCFTVGAVPEMLRMNELMLNATQKNSELSIEERNNYLGESLVLMSFLQFNSITGMSEYQRQAGELMNRPTRCLDLKSPWTFGSPSILSLYHRDSGALDNENEKIKDCMPFYERISEGHGRGAEFVFEAESRFFRGDFDEAKIALYRAVERAEEKEQYSILAAAAFLAARMDLIDGDFLRLKERFEKLRRDLKREGQLFLLTVADMGTAWCYALLGRPEYAPDWVADSSAAALKGPAWASFLTVRDQLLLSRGDYLKFIALGLNQSKFFNESHALLSSIYLHIQLAGANLKINRTNDARYELETALSIAEPDELWLPFAENGVYVRDMLKNMKLSKKFSLLFSL